MKRNIGYFLLKLLKNNKFLIKYLFDKMVILNI